MKCWKGNVFRVMYLIGGHYMIFLMSPDCKCTETKNIIRFLPFMRIFALICYMYQRETCHLLVRSFEQQEFKNVLNIKQEAHKIVFGSFGTDHKKRICRSCGHKILNLISVSSTRQCYLKYRLISFKSI